MVQLQYATLSQIADELRRRAARYDVEIEATGLKEIMSEVSYKIYVPDLSGWLSKIANNLQLIQSVVGEA